MVLAKILIILKIVTCKTKCATAIHKIHYQYTVKLAKNISALNA